MKSQYEFDRDLSLHFRQLFSGNSDYVKFLMENLGLNYEPAYRRAKGDISFTFREVAVLAEKLNLSVDKLLKYQADKLSSRFGMSVEPDDQSTDYIACYRAVMIEPYERIAELARTGKVYCTKGVHATLPPIFLLPYRSLTRFTIFQWAYQLYPETTRNGFASICLPDDIIERQDRIYKIMTGGSHHTTVLFGHNLISSFVKQLNFFNHLGAISPEDLAALKTELLAAVDDLEEIARRGGYPLGNEVAMYLADIDFGANYIYMEMENYEMTTIDVYMFHTLESYDEPTVRMHLKWGESLKKYSTLVSGTGDVVRSSFFREQRAYIEKHLSV